VTSTLASAYVVGIVPRGAPLPDSDASGPLAELRLVETAELAAVVGTPPTDRQIGRAADLLAHDRLLADLVAAGTPVLPMRFGTVLDDDAAVITELLEARRNELVEQLDRITGRVQYTVKVHYDSDAVLRELVAEEPQIRRLRSTGSSGAGGDLDRQIRLGQLVVQSLERRRPADAAEVLNGLGARVAVVEREPAAPEQVLNAAFLVERSQADEFEASVERVAERHAERLRFRLVGPSPAYDFVGGR
jgi:hypothetical protein